MILHSSNTEALKRCSLRFYPIQVAVLVKCSADLNSTYLCMLTVLTGLCSETVINIYSLVIYRVVMLCLTEISTATQKFHRTFYVNGFFLGVRSQQSCLLITLPSALQMIVEHFSICLFTISYVYFSVFWSLFWIKREELYRFSPLAFFHFHFKIILHLFINFGRAHDGACIETRGP